MSLNEFRTELPYWKIYFERIFMHQSGVSRNIEHKIYNDQDTSEEEEILRMSEKMMDDIQQTIENFLREMDKKDIKIINTNIVEYELENDSDKMYISRLKDKINTLEKELESTDSHKQKVDGIINKTKNKDLKSFK